jgi:hypothetical protein
MLQLDGLEIMLLQTPAASWCAHNLVILRLQQQLQLDHFFAQRLTLLQAPYTSPAVF